MSIEFKGTGDLPSHLLFFYGTECPHCHDMFPLIEQFEDETDGEVQVTKLEVWHNSKNAAILENSDKGFCGGVPFSLNTKTEKWICGAVDYTTFKKWATGN